MNGNLNVVAIEDNIVWADKNANMVQLTKNMDFVPEDADLVILPEMFSTGFIVDKSTACELAERNTENTIYELREIADKRKIAIAGSFLARTAGKLYNRAFFIEPNGDETFYDKRHLFRMGGEREVFSSGNSISPVIRYRGWNIKLVVCYDLRFPVWCRNAKDNNYDLLIVVANWPKSRVNAWTTLLQARAIENECYVCGVNRSGKDAMGVDFSSASSVIVDFKGNILAEKDDLQKHSQIISAVLDYEKLKIFREKFPVWMDADEYSLKF